MIAVCCKVVARILEYYQGNRLRKEMQHDCPEVASYAIIDIGRMNRDKRRYCLNK